MQKEILNPVEQQIIESNDSCPKCGNTLVKKTENNKNVKYCVTESFDIKSKKVTPCGFSKLV